jgi:hypothetical protein
MRKALWLAGLVLALGVWQTARAQQRGGASPIEYKVVDTSNSVVPMSSLREQSTSTWANFLGRVANMFSKQATGQPLLNVPGQTTGKNYFSAFGMHRPQRVAP